LSAESYVVTETLQIVCPHDAAVNRVPAARIREAPRCGKCHRPLFAGQPVELSAPAFERHLAQSQIPLLVDFWAPWCGPCRMMAPAFASAASLSEPAVRLAKVNTEEEPTLGARFGIRSIPTLVLFSKGSEVARHSGALVNAEQIVRWASSQLEGRQS
jgi:thioredoxin 2